MSKIEEENEEPFTVEEITDLEESCDFEAWGANMLGSALELNGLYNAKVYNPRRLLAAAKRDAERACFVTVDPDVIVGKPKVWDRALSKEEIKAESAPAADRCESVLYKRFNFVNFERARTRELAEQSLSKTTAPRPWSSVAPKLTGQKLWSLASSKGDWIGYGANADVAASIIESVNRFESLTTLFAAVEELYTKHNLRFRAPETMTLEMWKVTKAFEAAAKVEEEESKRKGAKT